VKDRPALSMIARAMERGEIKPGDTQIEATSESPRWLSHLTRAVPKPSFADDRSWPN
jgi:hypothetical protein